MGNVKMPPHLWSAKCRVRSSYHLNRRGRGRRGLPMLPSSGQWRKCSASSRSLAVGDGWQPNPSLLPCQHLKHQLDIDWISRNNQVIIFFFYCKLLSVWSSLFLDARWISFNLVLRAVQPQATSICSPDFKVSMLEEAEIQVQRCSSVRPNNFLHFLCSPHT